MTTPPNSTFPPEYLTSYNGDKLVAISIAFIPVATLLTALRCYGRHVSKASFGLDDLLALISWALSIGTSALSICFVRYGGVGHHLDYWKINDPAKIETYLKWLFTVGTYYYLPVAFPKLCILAFYYRIFATRLYRLIILGLAVFTIALAIVSIIVSFNLCHPLQYFWDRTIPDGRCYDPQAFYKWSGFPNILTDVVMLVLPIRVVWKLQTSLSIKIGLSGAFASGIFGLIGSILKFASFSRYGNFEDGTMISTTLMIWGSVEVYCYVIAACLVAFRPLVFHIIKGRQSKTTTYPQRRSTGPSLDCLQLRRFSSLGYYSVNSSETYPSDAEEAARDMVSVERPKALVIIEGGRLQEHQHRHALPSRIYVSRVWGVASTHNSS